MDNWYRTLNLSPEASEEEVKASYRRLAKQYHPDTPNAGRGDPHRFSKVHDAYRALLKQMAQAKEGPQPVAPQPKSATQTVSGGQEWSLDGVADSGADVIYLLRVRRQMLKGGLNPVLPWKAEDACPRCLGAGHTLILEGNRLDKITCPRCQGSGVVKHDSTVQIKLSREDLGRGRMVLKNLGHYQPTAGTRGNLIINVSVDEENVFNRRRWTT